MQPEIDTGLEGSAAEVGRRKTKPDLLQVSWVSSVVHTGKAASQSPALPTKCPEPWMHPGGCSPTLLP
jgi:hypothetical protein